VKSAVRGGNEEGQSSTAEKGRKKAPLFGGPHTPVLGEGKKDRSSRPGSGGGKRESQWHLAAINMGGRKRGGNGSFLAEKKKKKNFSISARKKKGA